jgi:hypothetical protein
MSKKELAFVSFEKRQGIYLAYLPMKELLSSDRDIEPLLKEAALIYNDAIKKMHSTVNEINSLRNKHILLPAVKVWKLGDQIYELVRRLERLSLQIDGIYGHLTRDLNVKRKWLEKVIIFRRYLPSKTMVPESINWGRFEKGTRRKAENLRRGIKLN